MSLPHSFPKQCYNQINSTDNHMIVNCNGFVKPFEDGLPGLINWSSVAALPCERQSLALLPHYFFTDEETVAQIGELTCPRSHLWPRKLSDAHVSALSTLPH